MARPRWQRHNFNNPLMKLLLAKENKRGKFLFLIDATLVSQSGKKTQNTYSTGNRRRRKIKKGARYNKKKVVSKKVHNFTFGLLITPSGIRIPMEIPHYTEEYCKEHGIPHQTTAESAAQMIRTLPLPGSAEVIVLGDTAYDAHVVREACEERRYTWIFPANPERVYEGSKGGRRMKGFDDVERKLMAFLQRGIDEDRWPAGWLMADDLLQRVASACAANGVKLWVEMERTRERIVDRFRKLRIFDEPAELSKDVAMLHAIADRDANTAARLAECWRRLATDPVVARPGTPPLEALRRFHHVNEDRLFAAMNPRSDTDSDTDKKNLPDNEDVRTLVRKLQTELPKGRSQSEIAREITGELPGDERDAQNLLRQARRFRHLWLATKTR